MCIVEFFFKDNVNEWITFACDETGPADESKRTKRVQGWSRLNWLGGILIIVSWHIHFNKLLMPFTPVCYFVNQIDLCIEINRFDLFINIFLKHV